MVNACTVTSYVWFYMDVKSETGMRKVSKNKMQLFAVLTIIAVGKLPRESQGHD